MASDAVGGVRSYGPAARVVSTQKTQAASAYRCQGTACTTAATGRRRFSSVSTTARTMPTTNQSPTAGSVRIQENPSGSAPMPSSMRNSHVATASDVRATRWVLGPRGAAYRATRTATSGSAT